MKQQVLDGPGHAALKRGLFGGYSAQSIVGARRGSWILPQSRATVATMRTMTVIFVLALIAVAFEIYSDAALTSSEVSHTSRPDPVTTAVGHALRRG
jgi:hypothetical protein